MHVICVCGRPLPPGHPGQQTIRCPWCGHTTMVASKASKRQGVPRKGNNTAVLLAGAGLAAVAAIGLLVGGSIYLVTYLGEQARRGNKPAPVSNEPTPQENLLADPGAHISTGEDNPLALPPEQPESPPAATQTNAAETGPAGGPQDQAKRQQAPSKPSDTGSGALDAVLGE